MLQAELVGDCCAAMRAATAATPVTVKCRLGARPLRARHGCLFPDPVP